MNCESNWKTISKNARQQPKEKVHLAIHAFFAMEESLYNKINCGNIAPTDTNFNSISGNFFSLASLGAAQPLQRDSFIQLYNKIRSQVKFQSRQWDMNDHAVRNLIYKSLYGRRAAWAEVLLQGDHISFNPSMPVMDEPSATPCTNIFDIKVHSGDLLV